ncbi:hypothetical protein K443DRAFT_12519 [Laccaria amethystina LaAM-08-1]|uniref:Uncharacterized protein n=1 Tax=Laccaria amethystina LaAM-08-1 TaxID=1095629 RepID=A0A0C9WJ15_9AGAR|nr:hypothetical protein K443DRAFT_12519 [Laccaria amethystina LaAM-08-1]
MQTSPNAAYDVVERRIQTLTSILQNMNTQHSPTSNFGSQVPTFLRHLATLLTCDDADAIAVTGTSLTNEELPTLVVTQNPFGSEFGVKEITKDKNSKLPQHTADVWAAIDSYDPNIKGQFNSFCLFIVARCFQKLSKRVSQDKGCWDVSVSQKIHEWTPLSQELDDVRWIERPKWSYTGDMGVLNCHLAKLGPASRDYPQAAGTRNRLNEAWCYCLCAYVHWKEDVVRTLLTKTSLANAFSLREVWNVGDGAESADELADMRGEFYESEGQQVLRHLQAIVAWHAAAKSLLDKKCRRVAQTLRVGLVEVASSQPDLMTYGEVIEEFFRRRPASSSEARISVENIIRENHTKKKFTGTTHAEATLMGLLTYFSPGSPSVNHGDQIEDLSLRVLKELIEPATSEKAIALPGSHGVLFSWTPPPVGVDVTVLEALENDLWDEMNAAVEENISRVHSCQSADFSTDFDESDEEFERPLVYIAWEW